MTSAIQEGRLIGGRFRIVRPLKKGFGIETFLGLTVDDDQEVVVKTASAVELSTGVQLRLEHEAEALQHFSSPYIAPLIQFGTEQGSFYLVIPLIEGETLEGRLARGALAVDESISVAQCVLAALHEAHSHGVLHRDVKPANVMVNGEGSSIHATLIDFGFSRNRSAGLKRDEHAGTVRYMSPEQAGLLDQNVDERSDLYSVGALLFECLAGRPPFTPGPPEHRSGGSARPERARGKNVAQRSARPLSIRCIRAN